MEEDGKRLRPRIMYSRSQLEALRFQRMDYQFQFFNRLYSTTLHPKDRPLLSSPSPSPSHLIDDGITDDASDDDDSYDGILKPALFVQGEPDFESGPPQDGWEYLRRVRWEANQLPHVRVAKLNLSQICAEQTPYMPQIPDLPKCPPNLLASSKWEDSFLHQFSQLRQAFSELESSVDPSDSFPRAKSSTEKQSQNVPTVSTILNMDAVCRAATLGNYINMCESMERLSKHDCLWLFALCATVDMPLHADTCASLRCLLRKCLGILASKSEMDAEVPMLHVLVSICGKYFGQYDNTSS